MYKSQWKQDQILNEQIFKGKKDGFFIDVGANDGESGSNSFFFEKHGWEGICIEPIPECFEKLKNSRNCICIQGCAYNKSGTVRFNRLHGYTEMLSGIIESYPEKHKERIEREMKQMGGKSEVMYMNSYKLSDLIDKYKVSHVDYLSIDTEGSELQVLEGIDFNRCTFGVINFEVNYEEELKPIHFLLNANGYKLYTKLCGDLVYIPKKE